MYTMYKYVLLFISAIFIGCTTIEEQEKEESLMEKTILYKDVISKVVAYQYKDKIIITTNSGKVYQCFDGDFGALVPGIGDTVYTIRLKDKDKQITKVIFGESDGCAYKYTNTSYG